MMAGFEDVLLNDSAGRSTDVEGSHRQLCSRFADRLRGYDSNRFSQIGKTAGCEIAAVAPATDSTPRFACQHGADLHAFNAGVLDSVGNFLIDRSVLFEGRLPTKS